MLPAPLENNPSIALGTGEVTLLDVTSAYVTVRPASHPSVLVGVWVGNADHSPVKRVVGGSLPVMI